MNSFLDSLRNITQKYLPDVDVSLGKFVVHAFKRPSLRTRIMLGGLRFYDGQETPFTQYGLMQYAAADATGRSLNDCGPNDVQVWQGNWWLGEKHSLLYVEVENDWKELFGTIRDLFSGQALRKWGVFYHQDPVGRRDEVESAVRAVANKFRNDGFQENPGTPYEILVLPNYLSDESIFGGLPVLSAKFTAGGISEAPVTSVTSF